MSQDKDWYQRFLDAVSHNLPPAEVIGEEIALGWLNNQSALRQFLAGLCPSDKDIKELSQCNPGLVGTELPKSVRSVTIPARDEPINLAEFYQDGPDLAVDGVLTDRLSKSARQVVSSAPERSYVAVSLKEIGSTDIPKYYPQLSTWEDLAALIVAQLGGQPGFLLNNGASNLAFVKEDSAVTIVDIIRIGCDNLWWVCDVDPGDLGDDSVLDADSQVLLVCSPAS
ncbi:MAG: hypothetical protein IPJ68_01655 [Candidatus Moraniibacteriota bacterium]|nr:MAG: hypothetical protein IPJ68_01655 [Candidatus Moranbacteria bacterium]